MTYPESGKPCPVCGTSLLRTEGGGDSFTFTCLRCGNVRVTGTAYAVLEQMSQDDKKTRALLSYVFRRMQRKARLADIDSETLRSIRETQKLPEPREMLDNLVEWLGYEASNRGAPENPFNITVDSLLSVIGAISNSAVPWVVEYLEKRDLITVEKVKGAPVQYFMQLTFDGWDRYESLKRGSLAQPVAFMAMQFNDAELDGVVDNCFRGAVSKTGFELRRLNDHPKAGPIDDRMRSEIRSSMFLIADLTHGNRGAYWESGFAEGLGKPVIYTCRKDVFENPESKPHFDTNHHLTVVWDPVNLSQAETDLKATIRATLVADAKQIDD